MRGADGALSGRRGVDAYGVAWVRAKTRTRVRRAHVRGRALRPSVHMATVHRATVGSAVCDPRWRPLEEEVKAVEKILVGPSFCRTALEKDRRYLGSGVFWVCDSSLFFNSTDVFAGKRAMSLTVFAPKSRADA